MIPIDQEQKEKHLAILARAFFDNLFFDDSADYGSPSLNVKRPFGNSYVEGDILELLNIEPEEKEGRFMVFSKEQDNYARKLYVEELIPFLQKVCVPAITAKTVPA